MTYRRLVKNLNKSSLIPFNDGHMFDHVTDFEQDWYISMYHYEKRHKEIFDQTGSVKGITDNLTFFYWWDFDSAKNLDQAQKDACTLVERLLDSSVPESSIQIAFSGNKGFSVIVPHTEPLTKDEVQHNCLRLAKDLPTFDSTMYDNQRIFRIPFTKNLKTGLYKQPLTREELFTLTISDIQALSASPRTDITPDTYDSHYTVLTGLKQNKHLYEAPPVKKKVELIEAVSPIDWDRKPKYLSNCRWYMQHGFFEEGNRSRVFLCLASTYRNQGFTESIVYRMLKGVAEEQAKRNNCERYPDTELYNNVVLQVFSPSWKGGQFTCKQPGWLQDYCLKLGNHACKHGDSSYIMSTEDIFTAYEDYVQNYDKNVLTFGVPSLDNRCNLFVGTSNAIVGSPGIGKTSIILNVINDLSKKGVNSIFFSYDMYNAALMNRMVQKHSRLNIHETKRVFQNNAEKKAEIKRILAEEYKNVKFCFKSGQSPEDINETIIDTEDKIGDKVKLIVIDYNELVSSQYSDATAASAEIAQKIRQIANERSVAALTLLQPAKLYSTPDQEITNYNAAKGSGAIAQSLTLMLGISRPGFNPRDPRDDRYMNVTCLKNRNGGLFSVDLGWEGLTGKIHELDDHQQRELAELRERKEAERRAQQGGGGWE